MRSALLTPSRLKVARACRRKHKLKYLLGYMAVVEALVLKFGSLVHRGLEAWWLAKKAGLPQEQWLQLAQDAMAAHESDPFELAKAQVLLTGYHLKWKDEPFEVLGVEEKFNTELRNPLTGRASRTWRLAGKLDVRVRDLRPDSPTHGLVIIIEHKTSAEDITPGSFYWKRLRLDGQVSLYFEGAASLGHAIAGCLYDVVAKPMHRPSAVPVLDEHGNKIVHDAQGNRVRTAQGKWRQTGDSASGYVPQTRPETVEEFRARLCEAVGLEPNRYFQRGDVVRLDAELRDALVDAWQTGQQLREEELADVAPRNVDSCDWYGRPCEFFGVCTGEASLDDTNLFTRQSDVHPELRDPLKEGEQREQSNQQEAPV